MIGQFLTAGLYLGLGIGITALNWHRRTRLSGAALSFYSLVSSITFFMQQSGLIGFEWMVLREISLCTLITVISWTLIHEGDPIIPHRIVMAASSINIGICSVLSLRDHVDLAARLLFAYGTNVGFWVMAVALAWPGGVDHVRRWIRTIDALRDRDSPTPDFDFLIKRIDGK